MACMCARFAHNTVFSCENKRGRSPGFPFPSRRPRPEVPWRQSGSGEAGAPGRAVLREEAQRLLHTPEVLTLDTHCLIFHMHHYSSSLAIIRNVWLYASS